MRTAVVLLLALASAMAVPLPPAQSQDTLVDLTPFFQGGLADGHSLLANLTIAVVNGDPSINGRSFSLGSAVTMEVDASLTDLSASGKEVVTAKLILDAGAFASDVDEVHQIHIQALIRAINRITVDVNVVSEVVVSVDQSGNEMSRTTSELSVEDSVISSVEAEATTSDMFEIEVIILTHGGSKVMDAEESESSDSSDSSDSSESSDSSDSSDSSESADWDEKWDMYSSDVRTKIHRALHSVCSWFHRQPAYVKVCIGFGLALVLFGVFYTCLRCISAPKSTSQKSAAAPQKLDYYSAKNLDFPLDDLSYETKPLISFENVERV